MKTTINPLHIWSRVYLFILIIMSVICLYRFYTEDDNYGFVFGVVFVIGIVCYFIPRSNKSNNESAVKSVTRIIPPTAEEIAAYSLITLKVKQTQFYSFETIVAAAGFKGGWYEKHLENNKKCRKAILAPITSTQEEELVLFYKEEAQGIPAGENIYKYFAHKGFKVVEKPHPSLLFNAMAQLTEKKLKELGISDDVNIILPTDEANMLPGSNSAPSFLRAYRFDGNRGFDLIACKKGERYFGYGMYAFLLCKIKTN